MAIRRALPHGAVAMLVTAFDDTLAVDLDSMVAQARLALELDAEGIALFGLAGEGSKLSIAERVDIAASVVDEAGSEVAVIGTTDALRGTADAARVATAMAGAGVSHVMSMPPPLVKDTDDLVHHFATVTKASGVPCIIQDAPAASHVDLPVNVVADMVDRVPDIAGVKVEAPPIALKVRELADSLAEGTVLYGGRGGMTLLSEMSCGATGTMVGPAYIDLIAGIFAAGLRRMSAAVDVAGLVLPLISLAEGNDMYAQMQKHLLRRAGVIACDAMRPPSTPVPAELAALWEHTFDSSRARLAVSSRPADRNRIAQKLENSS